MNLFNERLRRSIEQSEHTQKEIAERCGLSSARLNNYVQGRTEPSFDVLAALCRALGVSADYLLGLSEASQQVAPRLDLLHGVSSRDRLSALPSEVRADVEHYMEYRLSVYQQEHKGKRA